MKKIAPRLTWLIMLVPAVWLLISWKKIPATVPLHFNLEGEVDRYGSKNELVLLVGILTVVNILVYLLLTNISRFDPKKGAGTNKENMRRLAMGISIFITAMTSFVLNISMNPESALGKSSLVFTGVGLLLAFIGNYMHSIKPNYFAGLRLPWTLENEDNWKRTHSLAGKLWFAGGIIIAIISLFVSSKVAFIVMISIVLIMVLIPSVYSYRLFRNRSTNAQN